MYYSSHSGAEIDGTMTIALNIARSFYLAKIPTIFIFNGHPDIFQMFKNTGVDVRRIQMPEPGAKKLFNPFYRRRFSKNLIELINNEDIDVLHLGQRDSYILNYVKKTKVMKVCQQDGAFPVPKPLSIFEHGPTINPKKLLKAWYRKYVLGNYKRADLVLSVSDAARKCSIVRFRIKPEVAFTVRPGIQRRSDEAKPGQIRREFNIKPDEKIILSVGRITKEKGVEDFGDIAKILSDRGKKIKFLFAGNARDENYYNAIKQKYGSFIIFIGHRTDIYNAYQDATLFTHFSHREGLGMVILEAAEFGLPCVGWDIPGTNEALLDGTTGLAIPFGDHLAAANAIEKLLDDQSELDRLVKGTTQRFNKSFSIEGWADRNLAAYDKRKKDILKS